MNTNTSTAQLRPATPSSHPALLWIGAHDDLLIKAITFLQKELCPKGGCTTCTACAQIREQQHHAVIWLAPEKSYTLEQLDIIFETIPFALDDEQKIFFVIQKADALTPACSNRLLKSLEEPPTGYHFLLLAQQQHEILPTIRSRCITSSFSTQSSTHTHKDLFAFFTHPELADPVEFLKVLDQSKIGERESVELVDQLLLHWLKNNKRALIEEKPGELRKAQTIVAALQRALMQPPMPGSSKLFWRDLYLQVSS